MRIICYGDSNTWGYDPRGAFGGRYPAGERWTDMLAALSGAECVNMGENGRRIPRAGGPELRSGERLIIMLGTNDLLSGAGAAGCASAMDELLGRLALPRGAALVVAPVPLERGAWVDSQALIDESLRLGAFYWAVSERRGPHFADVADWGVELAFDGVHFSAAGHAAFAKGIYGAAERAFFKEEKTCQE